MERAPREDKPQELDEYANELFSAVDFLFARRGIPSKTGDSGINRYGELHLSKSEIDYIKDAFIDNFIDPPISAEIDLMGLNPNLYPAASYAGVLVITKFEDNENIYTTIYTVWFNGSGIENIQATKDTSRIPKTANITPLGLLVNPSSKGERIFADASIDMSERSALSAMIAKL